MEKEYTNAMDILVMIFLFRIIEKYREFLDTFGYYWLILVMMIYYL